MPGLPLFWRGTEGEAEELLGMSAIYPKGRIKFGK